MVGAEKVSLRRSLCGERGACGAAWVTWLAARCCPLVLDRWGWNLVSVLNTLLSVLSPPRLLSGWRVTRVRSASSLSSGTSNRCGIVRPWGFGRYGQLGSVVLLRWLEIQWFPLRLTLNLKRVCVCVLYAAPLQEMRQGGVREV